MNKEFEARHNEALHILFLLSKEAERLEKDLVFLGGSAVQAMLRNPKRLSIDLDVYYSGDAKGLVSALESAGYRNTPRKSANPGLFEFHTARKNDVMVKIDFLKIRVPIRYAFKKEISEPEKGKFVTYIGKPEYLMAAKLSALALGTIGRKEESKGFETNVLKDVYDFNSLLDEFPDLEAETAEALLEITSQQNNLRKTSHTIQDVHQSLEKTLRGIARFGKETLVTQGALQNFSEYLYEGILGRTKLDEFRLNATGELSRTGLAIMAMRALYHAMAIQRKEGTGKGEEAAKKETDREYVSMCEKALAEVGEEPEMLHEFKIKAPKALIYLYCSKFLD
jgi:hypothetical protein